MSALRVLGLMMVSSWLVVGCSSAKRIEPGAACLLNTDCNNPLVCSMDKCHDACHGTADCPPGESCVKTAQGTVCQLPGEASCSQNTCGGILVCASDLRCRAGCLSPTDCAEKQLCVSGVCADTAELNTSGQLPQLAPDSGVKVAVGGVCILNSDCQQSLACVMNRCHDLCRASSECPAGQSCVNTPAGAICQLPAEAGCSATSCGGALVCASDLRCRAGCQSAVDCAGAQVCVSGVCADPIELDINGQLPQRGPGPVADAGADRRPPDVATKDSGLDLLVAPADAGAKDGGADATGPGPDVLADLAPTKLPDAGADLVAQPDLPAADLAADKLPSTTPDVNASTPDAGGCPTGTTLCGSTCVDTLTTAAHCGTCEIACAPGQICANGSCKAVTGCGVPATTTRYFCDDFESGIDKWTVSGYDWGLTTDKSYSPNHSLTDSPDGNYSANSVTNVTVAGALDLTNAKSPVLTFWDTGNLPYVFGGEAHSNVNASTNAGLTWTQIWTRSQWSLTNWQQEVVDLSKYAGQPAVRLRFTLENSSGPSAGDGWYIDDVEVRELQ